MLLEIDKPIIFDPMIIYISQTIQLMTEMKIFQSEDELFAFFKKASRQSNVGETMYLVFD